jgi:hypothetical protein
MSIKLTRLLVPEHCAQPHRVYTGETAKLRREEGAGPCTSGLTTRIYTRNISILLIEDVQTVKAQRRPSL